MQSCNHRIESAIACGIASGISAQTAISTASASADCWGARFRRATPSQSETARLKRAKPVCDEIVLFFTQTALSPSQVADMASAEAGATGGAGGGDYRAGISDEAIAAHME
jgi:hypothetical protein